MFFMVFSKVLFARQRSSMNYESFEEYDYGQQMTKPSLVIKIYIDW